MKRRRARLRMVLLLFLSGFGIICARLVYIQTGQPAELGDLEEHHIGYREIDRPRGDIVDRNGRILATDRIYPSLGVNPRRIDHPDRMAAYLSERLGLSQAELIRKFNQVDAAGRPRLFVPVKRWLREDERRRLGDLAAAPEPEALIIENEPLRYYPEGELAGQVLGFANRQGLGQEGLELEFDAYLRSKPGRVSARVDGQRKLLEFRTVEFEPPTGGDRVYTTLDTAMQFKLEEELDRVMHETRAPRAMGVVMDSRTGAILALATRPGFDPNLYHEYTNAQRRNRAIVDAFEPGSAFKIVTAAGALEHGLVSPAVTIDCENGVMYLGRRRIRDSHRLGVEPFTQCFAQSSNIAMIKVAAALGEERLEAWINRFGFGRRTGVDLPAESGGIFRPRDQWSGYSMGSLPMGQEISVTMLQLAQAFSVIANGGMLVRPHLVKSVVTPEGQVTYEGPDAGGVRILSEDSAETMRMLCGLVVESGTGRYAKIPEYRAGGKTGTAQIALENGGGYHPDKYTTVFAGFAPVRDPRITCVIVVAEPNAQLNYGGFVCGPVFRNVVRDALIRLNVPPDNRAKTRDNLLAGNKDQPTPLDPDTIVPRVELALLEDDPKVWGTLAEELELHPKKRDDTWAGVKLPDFTGKTKRQAKQILVRLGLDWDVAGAGRVVRQEPPAGTPIENVRLCKLEFRYSAGTHDDAR